MAILARGVDYFGERGFPVTTRRVRTEPGGAASHAHDVTEQDHYHDFTELVLVLNGRGLHRLDGEAFPVSAGDVFVIQGSQVHSFREREGLVLLNVMYDPAKLPLPVDLLRRMPGYSALFVLEPRHRRSHAFSSRLRLNRADLGTAEALGDAIGEEAAAVRHGHEALLLGHLLNLFVFLSRRYQDSRGAESQSLLRLGRLISELERSYDQPWDLARFASAAGLSRTSLLRVFRQATGLSPIAYLIGLRVAAAKRLLRREELDVTEIAQRTGFGDGNYFARQFRKVAGCTPSEFRRRNRTAR